VNKCYFCGGRTKVKKVSVDFRWAGKLFVVENVPVEICDQCGERYYSAEVSKKIDKLVKKQKSSKEPERILEVPVFSWQ